MEGGEMVPGPWRIVAAALAVAAGGMVWTGAYGIRPGAFFAPYSFSSVQAAVGILAWALSGILLWGRPTTRRLGTLMAAVAGAITVSRFIDSAVPLLFTVGLALQWVIFPLTIWALLGYPSGRLTRRGDRVVVIAGAAAATLHGVVAGTMYEPVLHWDWCDLCQSGMNLLLIHPVPAVVDAIYVVLIGTIGLTGGYTAIALLRRWLASTHVARRVRSPMLLPAIVYCAVITLFHLYEVAGEIGLFVLPIPLAQVGVIGWFAQVALPVTFLVGLAGARARRGRVADLVTELHRSPSTDRLEESLRRTLRDPSLEVGYWSPGERAFRSAAGEAVEVPTDRGAGRAVTAIDGDDGPLAVLVHDAALLEDARLLESTAAAATLAVENARLASELRIQLAEVHASRARIVAAADEARRRVERDLHDGAQQRLVSLSLLLRQARSRSDGSPLLDQAVAELADALRELRDLARGVYPLALAEGGLAAALDGLAERADVPTVVRESPEGRLPEPVEAAAYFVAAEAVTNAAKHAGATSVQLAARQADGVLVVEVVDDGAGGAVLERAGGLRGLRDRVEALDGSLTVLSPRGGGTTVRAEVPCPVRVPAPTAS